MQETELFGEIPLAGNRSKGWTANGNSRTHIIPQCQRKHSEDSDSKRIVCMQ